MMNKKALAEIALTLQELPGFKTIWGYNFLHIAPLAKGVFVSPNRTYLDSSSFVESFCRKMQDDFPNSLYDSDVEATDDELAAVENYILDYMCIMMCLDSLVAKYLYTDKKFEGWSFESYNQNYGTGRKISFMLTNKPRYLLSAVFTIQFPTIYETSYQDFGFLVNKFLSAAKGEVSVMNTKTGELFCIRTIPMTVFKSADTFITELSKILKDYNKELDKEN